MLGVESGVEECFFPLSCYSSIHVRQDEENFLFFAVIGGLVEGGIDLTVLEKGDEVFLFSGEDFRRVEAYFFG